MSDSFEIWVYPVHITGKGEEKNYSMVQNSLMVLTKLDTLEEVVEYMEKFNELIDLLKDS